MHVGKRFLAFSSIASDVSVPRIEALENALASNSVLFPGPHPRSVMNFGLVTIEVTRRRSSSDGRVRSASKLQYRSGFQSLAI